MKMTPSEAFVETLVANNVTEMFGIMGSAVSYVFRPTDKFMNRVILKLTGVAAPEDHTDTES